MFTPFILKKLLCDKYFKNYKDVGVVMRSIYKGKKDHYVCNGRKNLKTPAVDVFP